MELKPSRTFPAWLIGGTSNCTNMELKHKNFVIPAIKLPPSNCTNMELKLISLCWLSIFMSSSNCTNMELKREMCYSAISDVHHF